MEGVESLVIRPGAVVEPACVVISGMVNVAVSDKYGK
jgi:hypothetical protein